MKRADQERMLSEIFDDTSAAVRTGSLAVGLQAVRRRRRRRAAIVSTSTLSVLAAGFFLLFREQASIPPNIASPNFPSPATESHHVKMITDAELLALFHDRQVALIGAPGEQQLVFLDESAGLARDE